jgi:hypothetical protein
MSDEYTDRRNNDMIIGKLQEGVERQKQDTTRLETKIDKMNDSMSAQVKELRDALFSHTEKSESMIADMREQVISLVGNVSEIRKEVQENKEDFEAHMKKYVSTSQWMSDKFITISLIIAGMLGSAILTQYIFTKILPTTETVTTTTSTTSQIPWTPREETVYNYVRDDKGGVTLYRPPEPYQSINQGLSPQGGDVIVQGQGRQQQ